MICGHTISTCHSNVIIRHFAKFERFASRTTQRQLLVLRAGCRPHRGLSRSPICSDTNEVLYSSEEEDLQILLKIWQRELFRGIFRPEIDRKAGRRRSSFNTWRISIPGVQRVHARSEPIYDLCIPLKEGFKGLRVNRPASGK